MQGATMATKNLGLFGPGYIEEGIKIVESLVYTRLEGMHIIMAFEERGWALYRIGNQDPTTTEGLIRIIKEGRAWDGLEIDEQYLILPLCVDDDCVEKLIQKISKLEAANRGPRYVEIESTYDEEKKGFWTKAIGVYWVDSIVFKPHKLLLIMNHDPNYTHVFDEERKFPGHIIELGPNYLYLIKKQMTKASRH